MSEVVGRVHIIVGVEILIIRGAHGTERMLLLS